MRIRPSLVVVVLALAAASAPAQSSDALYTRVSALTGWEMRGYSFDSTVPNTSQWRIPVIAVVPVARRISLDLTANYFSARLESGAGTQTLAGFSDTQLRALYTVTPDRLAASLSVNLPTGQQNLSVEENGVAVAVGSNFLSFPVANVGAGFSATAGLAGAVPAGSWNVGLSGSFRYQGAYTALADPAQGFEYNPGTEIRVRGGADRLLGQRTRVTLGLTFSTFSTDEYLPSGQSLSTSYKPGPRWIGEASLVRVVGRSTLAVVAWDYYRASGKTDGVPDTSITSENIFNGEVRWNVPVTRRLQIEPLIGFRRYSVAGTQGGGGRMLSGGVSGKVGLNDRLSGVLVGRFDTGWVDALGVGRSDLTGYGFTAFLRYTR